MEKSAPFGGDEPTDRGSPSPTWQLQGQRGSSLYILYPPFVTHGLRISAIET